MVAELRERIVFDRPEHRAVIGLTEAEAAAVYVSGLHYQVFISLFAVQMEGWFWLTR
jgi:hypothetical protein